MSGEDVKSIKESITQATEIVFLFDTTGSMNAWIGAVRKVVEGCCEQMSSDIPGLKIGIMCVGDYCDAANYVVKKLKLTDNWEEICDFIRNTPNTGGGDEPEAYELALREAQDMDWTPDIPGKALVFIGDAYPHEVDYPGNEEGLDWRVELRHLHSMGVNVYPMRCGGRNSEFWEGIAECCNTPLMELSDAAESPEAIMGVAYAASGSDAFERYESRLCAMDASLSDEMKDRNVKLRAESKAYTDARVTGRATKNDKAD